MTLSEQVQTLAERVVELEAAQRSRSRTSSKPPSSDGYRKPAATSRRAKSGRRPGGQPGAPGTTLRQVKDPDVVIEHAPSQCERCHERLQAKAKVVGVARRQVADLPEPDLVWTEHQVLTVACGFGHHTTAGAGEGVPAWAVGPAQYRPRVRAAATYLMNAQFLPAARTAQTMSDLLGCPLSPGSVMTWQQAAAARLAAPDGFLEQVRDQLRQASVLHADETGLRTAALWRGCTWPPPSP